VGLQAAEMLAEVGHPGQRRRLLGVLGMAYASGGRVEEAEKVLSDLRGLLAEEESGELTEDWDCAMIEATLAVQRGQRLLAASWYAAATAVGTDDPRDLAESLVGLVATSDEPDSALARLEELLDRVGITLTAREQAMLKV